MTALRKSKLLALYSFTQTNGQNAERLFPNLCLILRFVVLDYGMASYLSKGYIVAEHKESALIDFDSICYIYPTESDCISHLEKIRWIGTPICPYCDESHTIPRPLENRHRCLKCYTTFSVTTQTFFHHSHIPLRKWLCAITMIQRGCCIRKIAKEISVNKNTAWQMQLRVRKAMQDEVQRQLIDRILSNIHRLRKDYDDVQNA